MMPLSETKKDVIARLQKDILRWQGFKPASAEVAGGIGLGPAEAAFPGGVFPEGVLHEFVSAGPEYTAASSGFIAGILNTLMRQGGACLWIGVSPVIFPPGLKAFGVDPDRVIFIDLKREKDVLWVTEEALKCKGLVAVISELREISFSRSQRLQLVVEKSGVTAFILRSDPRRISATACTARWQITPLSSEPEKGMPGVGLPRWNVELLKVRNGNPGVWEVEWHKGRFRVSAAKELSAKGLSIVSYKQKRKTG